MTREEFDEILEQTNTVICNREWYERAIKVLEQEPILDKIKGYIDHIRNTGMGKKKSLEFIEKFIEGLKAESENKE